MEQELYDFNAKMLNHFLHRHTSEKIAFTQITGWHNSHPYYRLNIYDGIQISQVLGIYLAFNKDWLSKFDNIVEIGTYNGGLSSYIYDSRKEGAFFVSYDIEPKINQALLEKGRTDIDFRIGDCFEERHFNDIANSIKRPGRTLMICDGGNKTEEFNRFSEYLKPGDIIILHDYKDESHEDLFMESKAYWQWPYMFECSYDSIKDAVSKNGLEKCEYNKFLFYMWGCFIKK